MRHSPLTPGRQGPTDPRELEAFLDMFFAETLRRDHIPGAAIIVVKDGQILLSNSPPG